jgi:putative membrane protein
MRSFRKGTDFMDLTFNILLILHLVSLVVGASTAVAMPVVMGRMAGAAPDGRQMLGGIGAQLGLNSRIAFGVLIVTGVAMIVVRYGGVDGMSPWFWAKMALVVVMLLTMIVSAVVRPGRAGTRVVGWVTRLALLGVVIAAVFAFN